MATRKQMDLLTAVEQIVEKAKGTGLSSEFYRKADRTTQIMGSTKPSAYLVGNYPIWRTISSTP